MIDTVDHFVSYSQAAACQLLPQLSFAPLLANERTNWLGQLARLHFALLLGSELGIGDTDGLLACQLVTFFLIKNVRIGS